MISFFHKSKNSAKSRLYDCIARDRETVTPDPSEKIRREIENVLKKYAEIEGGVNLEITQMGRNKTYISAKAVMKRVVL